CVLACGRIAMPVPWSRSCDTLMLRSSLSRSTQRAGLSRSHLDFPISFSSHSDFVAPLVGGVRNCVIPARMPVFKKLRRLNNVMLKADNNSRIKIGKYFWQLDGFKKNGGENTPIKLFLAFQAVI